MTGDGKTEPFAWEDASVGLRLVVLEGGAPRTSALPSKGTVVLGRGDTCGVQIDAPSISREHAALHVDGSTLSLEDLGSSNGTRVGSRRLSRGERVTIGTSEIFALGAVVVIVRGPAPGGSTEKARAPELSSPEPGGAMNRAYALAELVAPTPVCVLLLGETGVGKTMAAERIHARSGRSGELLKLNCAAVPESLLEGELFGYERGAFTGAQTAKAGLLEAASGGTLLLDEIGDMPLLTQAKLLHVVESGEVMRLGAVKARAVDVRFLSATHRDLPKMIAEGAFRADLYYRVNGIAIAIPPLRERTDELVAFAEHFLHTTCRRIGKDAPRLGPDAQAALLAHTWPGNLRELRNVMDRAAVLSQQGEVMPDVFGLPPPPARTLGSSAAAVTAHAGDLRKELDAFERDRIVQALEQAGGNQATAAALLGLPLRTLVARLTRFGLTRGRRGG